MNHIHKNHDLIQYHDFVFQNWRITCKVNKLNKNDSQKSLILNTHKLSCKKKQACSHVLESDGYAYQSTHFLLWRKFLQI